MSELRPNVAIQLAAVASKRTPVILSNLSNIDRVFSSPVIRPKKYTPVSRREKRNTPVTMLA